MTKQDWIRKLTSRKFWAAICTFVTGILIYIGKSASDAEQIAGLIMAGASAIAYIIGEGLIDAASAGADVYVQEPDEKPPEDPQD